MSKRYQKTVLTECPKCDQMMVGHIYKTKTPTYDVWECPDCREDIYVGELGPTVNVRDIYEGIGEVVR